MQNQSNSKITFDTQLKTAQVTFFLNRKKIHKFSETYLLVAFCVIRWIVDRLEPVSGRLRCQWAKRFFKRGFLVVVAEGSGARVVTRRALTIFQKIFKQM